MATAGEANATQSSWRSGPADLPRHHDANRLKDISFAIGTGHRAGLASRVHQMGRCHTVRARDRVRFAILGQVLEDAPVHQVSSMVPSCVLALRLAALLAVVAVPLLGGCAITHPPGTVKSTLEGTVSAARAHHQAGNDVEAAQLLEAALRVDPQLAEAQELRESLSAEIEFLFDHPWLGSNFARRPATERSTTAKILLYPLDRFLDLLDIVSLELHVGPGLYFNLHVTRALQAGIGFHGTGGLGWHDHRSFGVLGQAESGIVVVALGAQAYAGSMAGTSGVRTTVDTLAGLHQPSDRMYRELRDYWAIGQSYTLLILGSEWDVHPIEIADFFLGWGGIDILNDDFAHTRGLDLGREERRLIRRLSEMERSEETMSGYRAMREAGED